MSSQASLRRQRWVKRGIDVLVAAILLVLAGLRSVVIWCDRFNVAFGTAPVTVTG